MDEFDEKLSEVIGIYTSIENIRMRILNKVHLINKHLNGRQEQYRLLIEESSWDEVCDEDELPPDCTQVWREYLEWSFDDEDRDDKNMKSWKHQLCRASYVITISKSGEEINSDQIRSFSLAKDDAFSLAEVEKFLIPFLDKVKAKLSKELREIISVSDNESYVEK